MKHPDRERAIQILKRAIRAIDGVRQQPRFSPVYKKWRRDTQVALENVFGSESRHLKDFDAVQYSSSVSWGGDHARREKRFQEGLDDAQAVLQSMIDEVGEYWSEDARTLEPANQMSGSDGQKQVFLVHGHDKGLLDEVARFLEKLGLEPVVLHEQPDRGLTIIEKFEHHAGVPFAIALFTPDDEGRKKGSKKPLNARPRQNVLFEFGYFLGKLGRGHAVALVKGPLEILSDYHGVLHISVEEGNWRMQVVRELKAAGLDVDANLAF